jgi:hypothetical protein
MSWCDKADGNSEQKEHRCGGPCHRASLGEIHGRPLPRDSRWRSSRAIASTMSRVADLSPASSLNAGAHLLAACRPSSPSCRRFVAGFGIRMRRSLRGDAPAESGRDAGATLLQAMVATALHLRRDVVPAAWIVVLKWHTSSGIVHAMWPPQMGLTISQIRRSLRVLPDLQMPPSPETAAIWPPIRPGPRGGRHGRDRRSGVWSGAHRSYD